ncbi:MAG: hypothetical protein WBP96_02930, partial [Nitrososphaeraceae archaeon]
YSPFGNDNDDNHSGDSNSDDDGNWRDHDHSDVTNSGEGEASDSMSQAGDSYGASSDDTQSVDSASQEGSPNYDTNDLGASNNLAENSDSGSEISDPINSVENSADQSGTVDTPESNGSSNTDNSTSQSNVYIASDPAGLIGDGSMSIYSISMSNYSSNQNTQNPVDETLAAASGFMDALPSNATSSEKGGHEAGPSNSELSNQSASSGNSREPTLTNQTSTDGNLIGNQSSNTASSSSEGNSSSMRSPSAADPKDALLGLLGGSSNHHQMAISGMKTTVVNYGDVGGTNDASATVSLDKSSYTTQDRPEINVSDPNANVDPNSTNTVHVTVTSTTDKTGIPITLVETGPNTGSFEGSFSFTTGTSSATSIQIASSDKVRVSYVGTGIDSKTADVTNSSPPIDNPPPTNNLPSTISGESTNTPVVIATILSSPTTEASSQRTSNATSATASIISTSSAIPSVTARSGNKTISVPEEGNVTLSYTSLLSQGELTALPVKTTSELAVMNITQGANHKPGKLMALDNTLYIPVGTVFIIAPTDARFNGTITVVIPYNMTLAGQQAGQDVKLLHYTGSTWEDVTTFPPAKGHLVTGSLSTTLGPVVAAVKSE